MNKMAKVIWELVQHAVIPIIILICYLVFCGKSDAQDTTIIVIPDSLIGDIYRTYGIRDYTLTQPSASIIITSKDNKKLILDFNSSDTLRVSGDLPYDEAAKLFLEAVGGVYGAKCDSLKRLREELKKYKEFYYEIYFKEHQVRLEYLRKGMEQ